MAKKENYIVDYGVIDTKRIIKNETHEPITWRRQTVKMDVKLKDRL